LQALKKYVREVYHNFLSTDYAQGGGQALAINFMSGFSEGAAVVNLGEIYTDRISKRNFHGEGPFTQEFRVEVWSDKKGKGNNCDTLHACLDTSFFAVLCLSVGLSIIAIVVPSILTCMRCAQFHQQHKGFPGRCT